MPQILLLDASAARVGERLATGRLADVEVITWSPDAGLRRGGNPIGPEQVDPVAGWISSDVFAAGCMQAYGELLASFDSMRWLQSANAGLDHPVYDLLGAKGIRICKSGAQSIPIAEYVLAHALAHYQQVGFRRDRQNNSEWKAHGFRELWHRHWLIVGYGHIGAGVAKRAKAFDCEITVIRQRQAADDFVDQVAPLSDIGQYLPVADFVVLACPATDATVGMVDKDFLARMKSGAVLVNIARGSLIDETALVSALDSGPLEHAILDVFATEPLPADSPLWSHPGVTVSAHTSNAGDGTRPRGDELFLDNLTRFLDGEALYDEVPAAAT